MNLITAKSLDQIALKGVKADWVRHDGSVIELRFTDCDGRTVTVSRTNDYSKAVSVLVPEPPKTEARHVLHGEVAGVPIKKAFEHAHEAQAARDAFPSDAVLIIDKVEVPVNSDGEVLSAAVDDMPF